MSLGGDTDKENDDPTGLFNPFALTMFLCVVLYLIGVLFFTHSNGIYFIEVFDHFVPTFSLLFC